MNYLFSFTRCELFRVTGYLTDLSSLPVSVRHLRLSFTDDNHARKLIKEIKEHRMVLEYLGESFYNKISGTLHCTVYLISLYLVAYQRSLLTEWSIKLVSDLSFTNNYCSSFVQRMRRVEKYYIAYFNLNLISILTPNQNDMCCDCHAGIHVMKEVCGETPEPLPMAATLWLSMLNNDTKDVDRIVKVVKSFMPQNK